jgi:outer membrane receptor protein involved in Fe transport
MRRLDWALLLAFAGSLGVALAQTTGDIAGRVTDATGAPLPGATVEARSPSLQGVRSSLTGRDGFYRFPQVPPGAYTVTATLSTFRPVERTCVVSLDMTATVDLTILLETEAQVVVSGKAPTIDSTNTTTGTNYTSDVIDGLPVDRNYADIIKANPGVLIDRGDTQGRFLALSIYGATSAENQWIIDGVNATSVTEGIQGKAINNEFVQEVQVKTGGYQAEYGRALGGVINVITKSGGNIYRGGAFVYYDSNDTAAAREFKPGDSGFSETRIVDGNRFDYGADLGGFILKDRLWFFGAYNRVSHDQQIARAESSTYVSKDVPFPLNADSNLYSGKLTWNVVPSTTAVGTVFSDGASTAGAAGALPVSLDPSTWYSTSVQGGVDYALRLTQLFGSNALATLQGSSHHEKASLLAADGIRYSDLTCVGGTPEHRCNLPPEPNSITGGYGNGTGPRSASRQQLAGNVTLYAGDHELRAGGDYMDGKAHSEQLITGEQLVNMLNEYGTTYYSHRFFAVSATDRTPVPFVNRGAQVLDYGGYLQDTWRLSAGLTVNAGIRWDGETTRDVTGQTVLDWNDMWQPRLGVAWDPWENGATKIYASAGRFSYALPTVAASTSFGKLFSFLTFNYDPVSVVQDPTVPHHGRAIGGGGSFSNSVDAGLKDSYQDELTVGIERMLDPTLTVGVKGTYRRLGNAIESRCDLDYTQPETDGNQCAFINPGSNGQFASGNVPTCDGLYDVGETCSPTGVPSPAAKRIYRGIELLVRKSVGTRLWLQASYVHSSLRGNFDGGVNQLGGETRPALNDDYDYPALWHNAYGDLSLDRPNRFRFDGYWTTPLNLTVGLQAFAQTGEPLSRLGFFNSGYGAEVFLVPRGTVGRLPTLWNTNLTLSYPIVVGPATVTAQAYLFNVFNKQIATSKDQGWTTSPPDGFPATLYDPNQAQNNPDYGAVLSRSDPRLFRAAVKVAF